MAGNIEGRVNSPALLAEYAELFENQKSNGGDLENVWDATSTPSSPTSTESSRYDVSRLEAQLYYLGIRGPNRWGPELIYRTSKDVFKPPSGPEHNCRLIQAISVENHPQLGEGNIWPTIRSKVRDLLEMQQSAG